MAQRILLLTLDPDLRNLLHDYLLAAGHQLCLATSGEHAQSLLRSRPFDTVIAEARQLPAIELANPEATWRIVSLVEMGEAPPPGHRDRVRVLAKPASLHAISHALADLELQGPRDPTTGP